MQCAYCVVNNTLKAYFFCNSFKGFWHSVHIDDLRDSEDMSLNLSDFCGTLISTLLKPALQGTKHLPCVGFSHHFILQMKLKTRSRIVMYYNSTVKNS